MVVVSVGKPNDRRTDAMIKDARKLLTTAGWQRLVLGGQM
jgi:hypothetical protein